MDREALEELKRLCEKATPGPWHVESWESDCLIDGSIWIEGPEHFGFRGDDMNYIVSEGSHHSGGVSTFHNAKFIAAARTALPKLIADVELSAVYSDIKAERVRQDEQWGGPDHDDMHTREDWTWYRQKYEVMAWSCLDAHGETARMALIKIAALAVAQLEALDRKYSPPALQSGGSNATK